MYLHQINRLVEQWTEMDEFDDAVQLLVDEGMVRMDAIRKVRADLTESARQQLAEDYDPA